MALPLLSSFYTCCMCWLIKSLYMFFAEDFMWRKCKKLGTDVWSEGFKGNKELDKRHRETKYNFF